MTRINSNIDPADLIDQHLLAEYREIIRIPNAVTKLGENILDKKLPIHFTLGPGHVLFFYNKLKFIHRRFIQLKAELDIREIANNITDKDIFMINNLYFKLMYNEVSDQDLILGNHLISLRIVERISEMKRQPTINKKQIDCDKYSRDLIKKYNIKTI